MLVKWVTCEVTDTDRFAAGQAGWSALRAWPGLLGQAGGWSTRHPGRAHVFGCWRDRAAYHTFMAAGHDRIAAGQAGTYRAIEVRLFDEVHQLRRPLPAVLAAAWVLRLAHGPGQPGRPLDGAPDEPVTTPGFLGGCVAASGSAGFLVLTAWRATGEPVDTAGEPVDTAGARRPAGEPIRLVPAWTVGPAA
ncbi:YdbC family protein [Actinoplanes teichomyceticus]|uniref:YdbC family protein n=1 Tax=Actinoplanes teichomyceticus TaxID=1867 RepID=UPI0013DDACB0|nr:YdbC family protein [Actinoplanes teichomyceticus]GIF16566.1 hypothetical protein Ate01nite_65980 [Actinoplanes teichomyceticus]